MKENLSFFEVSKNAAAVTLLTTIVYAFAEGQSVSEVAEIIEPIVRALEPGVRIVVLTNLFQATASYLIATMDPTVSEEEGSEAILGICLTLISIALFYFIQAID